MNEKSILAAFREKSESHNDDGFFKTDSFYKRVSFKESSCIGFHDEVDLKKIEAFISKSLSDQREEIVREVEKHFEGKTPQFLIDIIQEN